MARSMPSWTSVRSVYLPPAGVLRGHGAVARRFSGSAGEGADRRDRRAIIVVEADVRDLLELRHANRADQFRARPARGRR